MVAFGMVCRQGLTAAIRLLAITCHGRCFGRGSVPGSGCFPLVLISGMMLCTSSPAALVVVSIFECSNVGFGLG